MVALVRGHRWLRRLVAAALLISALPATVAAQQTHRSPTPQDLFALRDLGGRRHGLSLSPDGTQVALFVREARLEENDYRYTLLLVPVSTGAPQIIGDGGDAILQIAGGRNSGWPSDRVARWSPDGRWIAYLARHNGASELWASSSDGRERTRIADGPGDVLEFAWIDSTSLVFKSGPARSAQITSAQHDQQRGFRLDDSLAPYWSLSPSASGGANTVWATTLGHTPPRPALESEVGMLTSVVAAGQDETAVSRDGTEVWIAPSPKNANAYRPPLMLRERNAAGQETTCTAPECSGRLERVWWSADNAEIYFQRAEGFAESNTAIYGWRPTTGAVRRIWSAPDLLIDCAIAADNLVCLHESTLTPRDLVRIDLANGAVSTIYDPNPQWRDFTLTPVERLDRRDRFGNEFFAHLVYPVGYQPGRRYPLVIVQYRSRGFLLAGTGGEYPIHVLAAHGYFVLSVDRPDPRVLYSQLSANEVERRTEFDGSEQAMKQSALDILIDDVVNRGLVDRSRIALTGLSDGAETVYWALTHAGPFATAIASSPPPDPLAWTLGSEQFRRSMRDDDGAEGPWPDATGQWAQWWANNTTVLHADAIKTPLLLNLSSSEALLAMPLYARLREHNQPVEAYIYPGAFHLKWQPRQLLAAQQRAIDWLDFWLANEEHNDPDDPERIDRWRRLRDQISAPNIPR